MQISEQWLREWVNCPLSRDDIASQLTQSGIEVESITPVAEPFSEVVVGVIESIHPHPNADRLQYCTVNIGQEQLLSIVCGAKNIVVNMKVPVALVGAQLPNNFAIKLSKIRGVTSEGMLCSAKELGLSEESEGILSLPHDAPLGFDVWTYLQCSDHMLHVSLTPNRGDCLSIRGLAREAAIVTHSEYQPSTLPEIPSTASMVLPVTIEAKDACPRYVGRVIRGIKKDVETPLWMKERLRRAGMRCIHPVVDVTNYVMIEYGQPMHAFDLQTIAGEVTVRMAKPAESLVLLNTQTIALDEESLVIADAEKPIALAGVMGGAASSVTADTTDIFLESAFFNPTTIARQVRFFNISSDSAYRFERGVDPTLPVIAIERATQLLIEIMGDSLHVGCLSEHSVPETLPSVRTVFVRLKRIERILGVMLDSHEVENLFKRLGFSYQKQAEGFWMTIPLYRFDLTTEIDLIEEVARLYSYANIPLHFPTVSLQTVGYAPDTTMSRLRASLMDLGYQEIVSYAFVDPTVQSALNPQSPSFALNNPISEEMSVMRTSLWSGLMKTLLYNHHRQQHRVRLFELGVCFLMPSDGHCVEERRLGAVVMGTAAPEQWGLESRPMDFFDVKGDVENLLSLLGNATELVFQHQTHPTLHPGQSAAIYQNDRLIGLMGALHPRLMHTFDLPKGKNIFLFEIFLDALSFPKRLPYHEVSKFPEIRRDIAIWVETDVSSDSILKTVKEVGGDLLKGINVFDVYQGKEALPNQKSIALALTLQHASRTLVDEEVSLLMTRVIDVLKTRFSAKLRG